MSSVTLWGAVYNVDNIEVPKTGGGVATYSEGGGGGDTYTRTVVCPQQTVTPSHNGTYYAASLTGVTALEEGAAYIVTIDDTEWYCTCVLLWGTNWLLGEINYFWGGTDLPYPFGLIWASGTTFTLAFDSSNARTVKVEKLELDSSGG